MAREGRRVIPVVHKSTLITFLLGLLVCVGIWLAVPYNNFALNNSFVSDGYLPEIVLICMVVMVLGINPLLRRWCPRAALGHAQLALLVGMMLFAAVLPGNGLLRFFPHCVAYDTERINQSLVLAPAIKDSDLPPALFPDPIGYDVETPVSSQLIDELDEDAAIPWAEWMPTIMAWGSVIVSAWIMMLGLALIVYPQWREVERLPFPLLKVYHALIDAPAPGQLVPPVFRSVPFWVGCGVVFFLHSLNGLALFTDGAFPGFPISWNIGALFADGVWRYAPGFLKGGRLYFVFIGLAYFMPNRYSFSIWFTVLTCGIVMMVAAQYAPTFDPIRFYDQGCGALIAIGLWCVWLGRAHYTRVLRDAVSAGGSEAHRTNALAGRLFLAGCAAMLAWFMWAGAGAGWSLFFVVVGVMIMFVVARIVAETGLTYVWIIPLAAARLMDYLPQKWQSVSVAFLRETHNVLFNRTSAVSVAVMMALALGLNRGATASSRRRLSGVALIVLMLGLVICGAVHMHMGYTLDTSFDGKNAPITGRGARLLGLGGVESVASGRGSALQSGELGMLIFGVALAIGLLFLCSRFPRWPLHPIGLIFVYSSIGLRLFMSLFIGWSVKTLIVTYGGARAYRASMPVFLGLILGEAFANAFWTLVPILQILFGVDPVDVPHMIIFQYT